MDTNPVVELAKERNPDARRSNTFVIDGVQIRLVGVPSGTIQDAVARIPVPDVPLWYNPDKGREEPNPNDPSYLKALEQHRMKQGQESVNALIMFGSEIENWPPDNDKWLRKIKLSAKLGTLDLSWVDWDDEIDQQFLFLKYRAMTTDRIAQIGQMGGFSEEALAQARQSFQRSEE